VRARSIGFVFQLHNLLPALTARENVEIPLRALGVGRSERRRRAAALLETVGLGDRLGHRPGELSGGERQRVAVARAVVNEPRLVLADEPTGDLDRGAGLRIMELLAELRRARNLTVVLVTHNPDLAAAAPRTVRVLDGRVVANGQPVE
jgi:putative ABC transport system ATP-binding protein